MITAESSDKVLRMENVTLSACLWAGLLKVFFSSPLFIPIYIISTVFFTVMFFNCANKCGCLRRIVFTFSLVTNVITCSLIFRGNIFTLEVIKVLPLWTTNYKELVGMDGRHIKPKDFENHVYKLALELHLWFFLGTIVKVTSTILNYTTILFYSYQRAASTKAQL